MKSILQSILAQKQQEIALLKQHKTFNDFVQSPLFSRKPYSLSEQLENHFGLIAEFKRKSPSAGNINTLVRLEDQIRTYSEKAVAGISILTDHSFFGGNLQDLQKARELTTLPILRKDFILDELQLFESKAAGADAILLIAEALDKNTLHQLTIVAKALELEVVFEIHSFRELEKINEDIDILLINNRNLHTQETDIRHSIMLFDLLPENLLKIAASGVRSSDDLETIREAGFNGVLVGESLMRNQPLFISAL